MSDVVTGQDIYPHRPDLYELLFCKCNKCDNYVGINKKTKMPLGSIPTQELRQKRIELHKLIDTLWRGKLITRDFIYEYLSNCMNKEYHTSDVNSIEEYNETKQHVLKLREKYANELDILEEIKNFEL